MLTIQPIDLPIEAEQCLDELVAETGQSKDFHVRAAILEYLADIEDVRLAQQSLADIKAGREETIPLEEAMRRYDMAS